MERSAVVSTGIHKAMHRGLLALAIVAMTVTYAVSGSAALAADNYEQATSLFKARDYKNAAVLFRKAIFDRPGDANCFYYYALSLHYAKDFNGAKLAYLEIINRYPTSDAASRAQQGLNAIAPGLLASAGAAAPTRVQSYSGSSSSGGARPSGSASSGDSSGTSGDIIPPASIVNFDLVNSHMVVDVAFNGRRTKAIFDTGAEMILMGKNHLSEIGLPPPTGETIARSRGVGGRIEEVWGERMDVTCGGVTRKNIMVHIQEHMDTLPLLGLPFVKGMNYGVEENCIRFSAKQSATTASGYGGRGSDYNSVPYTMKGHTMVVQAKVNGKDTTMCLDTGAASTLFTTAQAAALGINVADEAQTVLGSGVGGAVTGRYTTLGSLTLGPVQQRDFKVGVSDLNQSPYPLLGHDFFEGHRFSVDEDRHVIHFN